MVITTWVEGRLKEARTSYLLTCDARSAALVRTVQFVLMNHHGITMMILVAVGGRFIAGYVSLKKTTIHG